MILKAKKGSTVYIAVYDWFAGDVEVVKDGMFSCIVRPITMYPCYSQYTLIDHTGEDIKLKRSEICSVENRDPNRFRHWIERQIENVRIRTQNRKLLKYCEKTPDDDFLPF